MSFFLPHKLCEARHTLLGSPRSPVSDIEFVERRQVIFTHDCKWHRRRSASKSARNVSARATMRAWNIFASVSPLHLRFGSVPRRKIVPDIWRDFMHRYESRFPNFHAITKCDKVSLTFCQSKADESRSGFSGTGKKTEFNSSLHRLSRSDTYKGLHTCKNTFEQHLVSVLK